MWNRNFKADFALFFIGRFRLSSWLLLTRERQVNLNLFSFCLFFFFNSFLSATRPSASRRRRNWNLVAGNQIAPLFADSFVVYSLESPQSAYGVFERCKITLSIITLTLKPCELNRYFILLQFLLKSFTLTNRGIFIFKKSDWSITTPWETTTKTTLCGRRKNSWWSDWFLIVIIK